MSPFCFLGVPVKSEFELPESTWSQVSPDDLNARANGRSRHGGRKENVLDVLIKYATAFTVCVYAAGFFAWFQYISILGAPPGEDLELANPRYLILGATVLGLVIIGSLLPILVQLVVEHPMTSELPGLGDAFSKIRRGRVFKLIRLGLMVLIPIEIAVVKFCTSAPNGAARSVALQFGFWFCPTCLLLSLTLMFPRIVTQLNQAKQAAFLLIASLLLIGLSTTFGAYRALSRVPDKIFLIIAPEAVPGVKELGMKFREHGVDPATAGISEAVDLASSSGRSYLVRLSNGHWVRISKEKVWGLTEQR